MKKFSKIAILALGATLFTFSVAGCESKVEQESSAKTMDHSKMSSSTKSNGHAYHYEEITDDIKTVVFSQKPLVSGNNIIYVTLTKNGKLLTDAKIKIKFFMPEMPGMPYMEYIADGKLDGDKYKFNINLGMSGTWQYQLKFKTSDNKSYKIKGSVNM